MAESVAKQGFQGSETSRVEITAYSFGDESGLSRSLITHSVAFSDAGVPPSNEKIDFFGKRQHTEGVPYISRVTTSKQLGAPAGIFSFDVKADGIGRAAVAALADDDWVDIVMTRHGVKTHVMRGQIEDIRLESVVVGTGATSDIIRVSGRDFGRIFELTPIWFDILTDGALGAGATARVLEANNAFFADPATTVESILSGFLRELSNVGRSHWEIPPSLQNIQRVGGGSAAFIDNACFFDRDFINHPARANTLGPSIYSINNQSVWNFALQWADLGLCEIYTDLLSAPLDIFFRRRTQAKFGVASDRIDYAPPNNDLEHPVELTPADSIMAVVFRDRPFPSDTFVDRSNIALAIEKCAWFNRLPLVTVPRQHVTSRSVGRSGAERRNAFFVKPRLYHELAGSYFDFNRPLFHTDDMKRHGMRRMDTTFVYTRGADDKNLALAETYKRRMRDYHCMNHLFYNGTITLGYGRPDIRIGTRFRISNGDEETQETYYVESVNHEWTLRAGLRTSLGVSRGWVGSDGSLVDQLRETVQRYFRVSETAEVETDEAVA
jgi:hypothetical protein